MLPPLVAISRGGQQHKEVEALAAKKPVANDRFVEKAANFKAAVEGSKLSIEREHQDRLKRQEMIDDGLSAVQDTQRREVVAAQFQEHEKRLAVAKFRHWSTKDLTSMAVLGAGAFGTVFLVRLKDSEPHQYFALKQMTKQRHAKKNIKKCVYNERDVLAQARNRWFVELFATFQDANNIFMLMEFLPGGDLFKWIETKNRFSLDETRFYMAELLEALDVLHGHGFIHRDIKFDNMILTAAGHLKLLDFGLCRAEPSEDKAVAKEDTTLKGPSKLKSSLKQGGPSPKRQQIATQVGTVYYMAPEVMRGEVSPACDIWAVGVMTFECLYGSPPFHAHDEEDEAKRRQVLRQMVLHHKKVFPTRLAKAKKAGVITSDVESFLNGVICDPADRLSIAACKNHAFFSGLDFEQLHLMDPPFKPELSGPTDLRNFDQHPWRALPEASTVMKDPSLEWANYEFDRSAYELQRPEAVRELLCQEASSTP